MSTSDESLVLLARNGDRPAFEELVRRTSRLVFVRLYLETGDRSQAEDLLQDTYLLAFRSFDRLTEPSGFRAWLLAIAHNVALDAIRREARRKRTPQGRAEAELDRLPGRDASPAAAAARAELRRGVLAALASLPEEYRHPLALRYLGGVDYDTICTQLGLSNGSLRGLLHRGLKLLRRRLPPEFAAFDD
jgi:RNA polymerase sigma-70 factor (ECF subfamily)